MVSCFVLLVGVLWEVDKLIQQKQQKSLAEGWVRLGLVGNLGFEVKKGKGLFQAKHQQLGAQLPFVGRITIHLRSCLGEVAAYSHI